MSRRALTAVALACVMVVPSLMQFALGALGPFLVSELSLSRADLGLITGCYYLAAAMASPLMGRMVGPLGPRIAGVLTVLLAGLGVACMSASATVVAMLGSALVGGAAAAIANPVTNLAISTMPRPHALLIGVKQSGVQGAAVIAGALLPTIALAADLRTALITCGALCVLALPTVAALPHATSQQPVQPRQATVGGTGVTRLVIYAGLMGAGIATVNTYLVLYAHERVGMTLDGAGALLAVLGLCAALARISGTVLVERATSAEHAGMKTLRWMSITAVAATAVIALGEQIGTGGMWTGTVSMGLSAMAFNGVAMLVVIRTADTAAVGRSSGRVQGAFFSGLFFSPPVFGLLVDKTGSYTAGWGWTALCFCAAAVVMSTACRTQRNPGQVRFAFRRVRDSTTRPRGRTAMRPSSGRRAGQPGPHRSATSVDRQAQPDADR